MTTQKSLATKLRSSALDAADPLRAFRANYSLPAPVYLCGNSLGPLPHPARVLLNEHLDKWAALGVEGHFNGIQPWATIEGEAAALSVDIIGAQHNHEAACMNSLTVNLHLMLTAFYRPVGERCKIIIEDHAFPSDEYAIQTHITSRGLEPSTCIVRLRPRPNEDLLRHDDILHTIRVLADEGTLALVLLPGVQYYTGQVFPIHEITQLCRQRYVPVGFDLAHAVGNIPLRLHEWGVDFAVWCTYKYLNSGPGAVAGLFLHHRHADADLPRHAGWWGHDRSTRFDMGRDFVAQRGALGFQMSNPPVMAIVPVIASLRLLQRAGGVLAVREKSLRLTKFLEEEVADKLGDDVEVISPREQAWRGCQLSLRLRLVRDSATINMHKVNDRLKGKGVVCDVREPDVLRVAPAPLYNSWDRIHWNSRGKYRRNSIEVERNGMYRVEPKNSNDDGAC